MRNSARPALSGGYYDEYRPKGAANRIDFHGRTVCLCFARGKGADGAGGVPWRPGEPAVHSPERAAGESGGDKLRVKFLPIELRLPFEFAAVLPVKLPLPTKITTPVLARVDIIVENPEFAEENCNVQDVVRRKLDEFLAERRLLSLG